MPNRIVVGVTGASGAIYARVLLDKLVSMRKQWSAVGVVMSDNARTVWKEELNVPLKPADYPFTFYRKDDFMAPFASGSAKYNIMLVCPCSMGTMGRIANGFSDDLLTRAADVTLKERRKLILVLRDTPYNLIHIENMRRITQAGGVIAPATPSFYSRPDSIEALAATVVDRTLDLAGLEVKAYRWGKEKG